MNFFLKYMEFFHLSIDTQKRLCYNKGILTQGEPIMHTMQYVRICDEFGNMEFIINRGRDRTLGPLSVVEIGHSAPCNGKQVDVTANCYQLHYVLKGEMLFGDNSIRLGKGVLIVPGENCKLEFEKDGVEHYWINFEGSDVHNLLYRCGLSARTHIFEYSTQKSIQDFLKHAFSNVFRTENNGVSAPIQHTHTYLLGLLHQLLALNEIDKSTPLSQSQRYSEAVCSYIRSHYSENLTINHLSDVVGLSPKYLCRIFHSVTGNTLIQYLTDVRLDIACHLLIHTDKSIGEIAASVGYSDALYFSKVFHSSYKISPSKFRKERV